LRAKEEERHKGTLTRKNRSQLEFNREIRDETSRRDRDRRLKAIIEDQLEDGLYREVCWDIEQRGSVGETWY
jgi:hypothetical protein